MGEDELKELVYTDESFSWCVKLVVAEMRAEIRCYFMFLYSSLRLSLLFFGMFSNKKVTRT